MKPSTNQVAAVVAATTSAANTPTPSALSLQYPQLSPDELNKVLDDVNTIRSKQKMVDDSLFSVKK